MAAARAAAETGAAAGDTSGPTLADVFADAQATAEAEYDAATAARAASVAAGFGDPIHPTTGEPLPATRSYVTAKLHLHFTLARSDEHTSELQSLMRISSAVFCLKKKK